MIRTMLAGLYGRPCVNAVAEGLIYGFIFASQLSEYSPVLFALMIAGHAAK